MDTIDRFIGSFGKHYGAPATFAAQAPGRLELLGNHTDYNQGFVLSCAVSLNTRFALRPVAGKRCRIADFRSGERMEFSLDELDTPPEINGAGYIRGVVVELMRRGASIGAFDAAIESDVPLSAGMSSSAALEISAALAIVQANSSVAFIAQAMGVSWGAMAGAFLAPFLYGLYWKRTTSAGCWASMIFSTVFMIIDMLSNLKILNISLGFLQSPINAGAFCMIAGLVLVPIVSLVSRAPSKDRIDQIFACYDRKVLVSAKDSIEVSEEA